MSVDLEAWNFWLRLNCNLRFPLLPFKTSVAYWLPCQRTKRLFQALPCYFDEIRNLQKEEIKAVSGSKWMKHYISLSGLLFLWCFFPAFSLKTVAKENIFSCEFSFLSHRNRVYSVLFCCIALIFICDLASVKVCPLKCCDFVHLKLSFQRVGP